VRQAILFRWSLTLSVIDTKIGAVEMGLMIEKSEEKAITAKSTSRDFQKSKVSLQ
jgi:hypothetical protein